MMGSMSLRWEWRTFGDELDVAQLEPEQVTESDETYLLSPHADDAVKLRAGLMDVKRLERVDDEGLELWRPVLKAPLPLSADDARVVLAALGLPDPGLGAYELDDLAAGATAVRVHKTRRHFSVGGCMAELTDLRAAERATRTIAIEAEQPARVMAAIYELGFDPRPNVSVPRGLKALLGP
jgi:exopolyphosphatase / guanosine-5'-triphosphate,3'-diphosphate pyrophosphatase